VLSKVGTASHVLFDLFLHFDLIQSFLQFLCLVLLGLYLFHFFLLLFFLELWTLQIFFMLLLLIVLLHKWLYLISFLLSSGWGFLFIIITSFLAECLHLVLLKLESGNWWWVRDWWLPVCRKEQ
jgi:hypothetical protein